MIDQYDIDKIKSWLTRAQLEGTDAVRIVAGDEPDTWVVRTFPAKYKHVGTIRGHLSAGHSIQEVKRDTGLFQP